MIQAALVGLIWSVGVSLVVFAATYCAMWIVGAFQDRPVRPAKEEPKRQEGPSVAYFCDGKPKCRRSLECWKNGGDCHRTVDIRHARNFRQLDDKCSYYMETDNRKPGKQEDISNDSNQIP